MNRSKLLLGVTSALLAVVGVTAAKAHRCMPVTAYYTNAYGVCLTLPFHLGVMRTEGIRSQYLYDDGSGSFKPTYTNVLCTSKAAFCVQYFNIIQ